MSGKKLALVFTIAAVMAITGCSSDESPTAVRDTAPPAVPVGLHGVLTEGVVDLNWQENTVDADYAGVLIYRTVEDSPSVLLTPTPVTAQTYRDENPATGVITYSVTAVDLIGNESAATSALIVNGSIHVPQRTAN
ncbi:MAG: hypothetical protein R6X25_06200 [Candidatus Krumholzibacteriia bacterium]